VRGPDSNGYPVWQAHPPSCHLLRRPLASARANRSSSSGEHSDGVGELPLPGLSLFPLSPSRDVRALPLAQRTRQRTVSLSRLSGPRPPGSPIAPFPRLPIQSVFPPLPSTRESSSLRTSPLNLLTSLGYAPGKAPPSDVAAPTPGHAPALMPSCPVYRRSPLRVGHALTLPNGGPRCFFKRVLDSDSRFPERDHFCLLTPPAFSPFPLPFPRLSSNFL